MIAITARATRVRTRAAWMLYVRYGRVHCAHVRGVLRGTPTAFTRWVAYGTYVLSSEVFRGGSSCCYGIGHSGLRRSMVVLSTGPRPSRDCDTIDKQFPLHRGTLLGAMPWSTAKISPLVRSTTRPAITTMKLVKGDTCPPLVARFFAVGLLVGWLFPVDVLACASWRGPS